MYFFDWIYYQERLDTFTYKGAFENYFLPENKFSAEFIYAVIIYMILFKPAEYLLTISQTLPFFYHVKRFDFQCDIVPHELRLNILCHALLRLNLADSSHDLLFPLLDL